nr:glycosyltransferase family 4 protein [Motilibacter deserti]
MSVLERNNWEEWRSRHATGDTNSSLPYGIDALSHQGWELQHSPWSHGLVARGLRKATSLAGSRSSVQLLHPVSTALAYRDADAALAIFEDMAWPWASPLGRRLPPLVVMTCWLGQRLLLDDRSATERWRRLAGNAAGLTVFSENQVPLIRQRLGLSTSRIAVLRYGIDTDFFVPASAPRQDYVAAVGGDVGRDWETFLTAAADTPEVRYLLLTWPDRLGSLPVPPNVEVRTAVGADYRRVLREAALVVVPTYPLAYPTGQSVLLEAMSSGAAVVATDTPALRGYLDPAAALPVPPVDAAELAAAVRELLHDPARREEMGAAGRRLAVERYGTEQMWADVAAHLRAVL